MLLQEVLKSKRVGAIYPCRFQPMGKHHFETYRFLVDKFGVDNVYIATSDVVNEKSPFNFNEKKKIMIAYGIPSNKIYKVKSPYRATEIISKLSDDTAVVFGFGKKDAGRLSTKYFEGWKDNNKDLLSAKDKAYVIVLPHVSLKVGGQEMSGTQIRSLLSSKEKTDKEKQKYFKQIMGFSNPSIYNLVTSKLKTEGVITEGGASGHMKHPYESLDMTFREMKKMITDLLSGNMSVEKITEKTDGQNINITWHNGQLVAARNKTQSKNFGENGLNLAGIKKMFAGRGELEKAFVSAMTDLETSISALTEKQRSRIFDNGHKWMNIEIIYQPTRNVIPYNMDLLQFHGVNEFDADGNKLTTSSAEGRELAGMIKQISQDKQSTFEIRGPQSIELPKSQDFSKKRDRFIKRINSLQAKYGLTDSQNLLEYHRIWWLIAVNKEAKRQRVNLTREMRYNLVKRFADGDKSFVLSKKNIKDERLYNFAKDMDTNKYRSMAKENMKVFEEVFLSLGAEVLQNAKNFIAASPIKGVEQIKKDLKKTISDLNKGGDFNKIAELERQLKRLRAIGGFSKIVPSEGIVFTYKGETYKLTGTFAPINQILGMTKF